MPKTKSPKFNSQFWEERRKANTAKRLDDEIVEVEERLVEAAKETVTTAPPSSTTVMGVGDPIAQAIEAFKE